MKNVVERIDLGPGLEISRVLTGLWQVADMERLGSLDTKEAIEAINGYVESGFTTFDMADHYGSAEVILGEFLREFPRLDIQLLTKWVPKPGLITREDTRSAIQRSLERLCVDSIDLLQFHAWSYADPIWLESLFWLQELKEEGLIEQLGVTNFDTVHLKMALRSGIKIVSNQISYSVIDQRAKKDMTNFCQANQVKLLAYGTLAGGFLSEKWLGVPEPEEGQLKKWSQMKYKRFIEVGGGWELFQKILYRLHEVAKSYDVSIANVAGRYILEDPAVGGIIIGMRTGDNEHICENSQIFNFELSEADRSVITDALEVFGMIPGDCGDEYRTAPFLTASGDLSDHFEDAPAPYIKKKLSTKRAVVTSGTSWEDIGGYSRAIRIGDQIWISGTTATQGVRRIGGNDPESQAHFIIDKIEGALVSLGGCLQDVVRTRIYLRDIADWEVVARVHGKRFGDVAPVNTLVQAGLVGGEYLVEIEADAFVENN